MIKVHCFTNLDNYKQCGWPIEFVCVPNIGDRVQAHDGKTLKIVAITHCADSRTGAYGPYLKIELHI